MGRTRSQTVLNGREENRVKNREAAGNAKNRSKSLNNSATSRMKRKANADPEETTSFPKQTFTRGLSLVKDGLHNKSTIPAEDPPTEEDEDPLWTPMKTSQRDKNRNKDKCQFPDCQSDCRARVPSTCYYHMIIHGSRRFHCSKCHFTTHQHDNVAQHLKGNCGGKSVDKLDQSMIDEWRQLSRICYPTRAKEINAFITKKEVKLLASSNLQTDQGATEEMNEESRNKSNKCQFPNCRSEVQHDNQKKCYLHLITHGPKRFTCSYCDFTAHQLDQIEQHCQKKKNTGCQGEIIDHIDQTMIDEWSNLAIVCFPTFPNVRELSDLFAQELAKSRDVQVVPEPRVAPIKNENEDLEALLFARISSAERERLPEANVSPRSRPTSPLRRSCFMQQRTIEVDDENTQNTEERIGRRQIEEPPLIPILPRSRSMSDVRRLDYPTTSGNASPQSNDVPTLSLSLVKDESSPRIQAIQQQDSGLQIQQLTQEVGRLKAENEMLNTRVADERKQKDMAQRLLGQRVTVIEMLEERILQLEAELEKCVVTLD
ncbi:unnamed protein product, partial [Mesorhabditis belari]|uniref:C2H2-type domain-containing protein n=1 Tax=Mesorhabditis belari TaxID=2138241 RepID=A0AAF3EV74_9BILA